MSALSYGIRPSNGGSQARHFCKGNAALSLKPYFQSANPIDSTRGVRLNLDSCLATGSALVAAKICEVERNDWFCSEVLVALQNIMLTFTWLSVQVEGGTQFLDDVAGHDGHVADSFCINQRFGG